MKGYMQYITLRLFELVVPSVALSAALCSLAKRISMDLMTVAITVSVSALLFAAVNFFGLRRMYNIVPAREYYPKVAFAAYGIYMLLSYIVYFVGGEIFLWTFLPTKFLHFIFMPVKIWMSISVFHILMLAMIPLAKLGVSRSAPAELKRAKRMDGRRFLFFFMDRFSKFDENGNEKKSRRRQRVPLPYIVLDLIMGVLMGKRRR